MKLRFSKLTPILLVAASVIAVFALMEIGIRVYEVIVGSSEEYEWEAASRWRGIHRMSEHETLLYELVPDAEATIDYGSMGTVNYTISSAGLRNRDVAVHKPEGAIRILVIGDSVTFGYYVPEESTFVARAERNLVDRGILVDVLNGGVGGYNTYNQVEWLKTYGLSLEPDLVVLAFCPNDVDNPYYHFAWHTMDRLGDLPDAMIPDPAMRTREPDSSENVWGILGKRSKFLSLFIKRIGILRVSFAAKKARQSPDSDSYAEVLPYGECLRELCNPGSPRVQWLRLQFGAIDSVASVNDFDWMILALPLSYQWSDGPGRCAQKTVSTLASEYGVPCLDPLNTPPDRYGELFFDPTHLTPRGHRWIGDVLSESLLKWSAKTR